MGAFRGSMWKQVVQFGSCAALLLSSSALGIAEVSTSFGPILRDLLRKPGGDFTEPPTKPFLGSKPGRDPERNLIWTPRLRQDFQRFLLEEKLNRLDFESMLASTEYVALVGDDDKGGDAPAEGNGLGGEMNICDRWNGSHLNSNTGNKQTAVPIVSWPSRGQIGVAFSLVHNSYANFNGAFGQSWNHSYEQRIAYTPGSSAIWRRADGLNVPFTDTGGGTYSAPPGFHETLVRNSGGTFTLTTKGQAKLEFDSSGWLTAVKDRAGNTVTIALNSSHQATAITDPNGKAITLTYTSGKVSSITDPLSRTWTFSRNSSGDLTSVGYPVIASTNYYRSFTYNSAHWILTETDRRGKVWTSAYDTSGRLASVTNPLSQTDSIAYTGSAVTVTHPGGQTEVDNYSVGLIASHVDGASYSEGFTYDSDRNVTCYVDKRGKYWNYTYDSRGNVLTATDPLSHVDTYTYNSTNDLLTETDALSHTTTYTYNSIGCLLAVVNPLSVTTATMTYDGYGQLLSVTDATSRVSSRSYDTYGNVTGVTDPSGASTTIAYDSLNRPTSATDALSNARSVSYDAWGRVDSATHPDSSTVSVAYNPEGAVTSATDELGHTGTMSYDDAGKLTGTTNARGDSESYGYNSNGWRTSVTNGRGKTRTYTFTARGEVASLTLPDSSVETWAYNGNGDTTAYVNPLSQTIYYVYDDAGRMTTVDYPSGTDTTLGYDIADRNSSMVDSTGTSSWTYDNADRTTQLVTPQGTLTYAYDNAGRRTSMADSTGTTSYSFDSAGRLSSLTNPHSETTSFTYDTLSRVATQTFANGQYDVFGYDSRSRQTSVTHKKSDASTISTESYSYDYAGNLSSKTVDSVTTNYTYDAIDQLLTESRTGYSATYTYDANGNRASEALGGTTETYSVDDADKLTSVSVGGSAVKTFGYDSAGRRTSMVDASGTTTYAYDYEDRLTLTTDPKSSTNSFTYNGLDTRVGKTDSGGSRTYRRDGVGVTAPVLSDGSRTFTPGISSRSGSASTFDVADYLGSATRQTNSSQITTGTRSFDAFGNLLSGTGSPVGPFGFAGAWGYQEDADSGLQLLGHRYYDASIGRFLTRDPAKDGRNWYGYCENNPNQFADPFGLGPHGVPPVDVPGGGSNNSWKWNPDSGNSRGGSWGPRRPLPRQSQPSASWEEGQNGRPGHWDVDDGLGNRQRFDDNGRPISAAEAHGRAKPQPSSSIPPWAKGALVLGLLLLPANSGASECTGMIHRPGFCPHCGLYVSPAPKHKTPKSHTKPRRGKAN